MERALFGLTTIDVRRPAYDFAKQMGIYNPFNNESKMAGVDWLRGFMSSNLTSHQCEQSRWLQ